MLALTVLQDTSLSSYIFLEKISYQSIIADTCSRPWVSPREICSGKLVPQVRPFNLSISRDKISRTSFKFNVYLIRLKDGQAWELSREHNPLSDDWAQCTEMYYRIYWPYSNTELCLTF